MGSTLSRPWTGIPGRRATGRVRRTAHVVGGVVGVALGAAGAAREALAVVAAALLLRLISKGQQNHLLCKALLMTVTVCQRQRATHRRRGVGDEGVGGGVLRAVVRRCGLRRPPQVAVTVAKGGRSLTAKRGRPPRPKGRGLGRRLTAPRGWALTAPPGVGGRAAVAAAGAVRAAGGVVLAPGQLPLRPMS